MAYLQQYIDPSLRVRSADTPETLTAKETDRLNELYYIAILAREIPRRLGADATDEELAHDAHTCRRVAHVAEQSMKAWKAKLVPPSKDPKRAAAQVRWDHWWEAHRTYLDNRMRYIATWQYKLGRDEAWAKGALIKLGNEYRWLEYALR